MAAPKHELPRYVGYAEIAEATGIDRRTIQRLMERGKFPKPDALPTKENCWRFSVVLDWLERRNADQIAALSDSAVTDPAKLKPDQVADALATLATRFIALHGERVQPGDVLSVGVQRPLTEDQRSAITAQAEASTLDFCDMFGRLDHVRALLVAGGLMPVLRPVVDQCLKQMTGQAPTLTADQLRELAVDIVLQSREGEFVGPADVTGPE